MTTTDRTDRFTPCAYAQGNYIWVIGSEACNCTRWSHAIPTNPPEAKNGRTFGLKVGHSYKFDEMIKSSDKLVPPKTSKKVGQSEEKAGQEQFFWAKDWDCPSKSWRVCEADTSLRAVMSGISIINHTLPNPSTVGSHLSELRGTKGCSDNRKRTSIHG